MWSGFLFTSCSCLRGTYSNYLFLREPVYNFFPFENNGVRLNMEPCDSPSNYKYKKKVCRCTQCRHEHNEYEKRRAKLRRQQPSDFIPAEETIQHIIWLTHMGMSLRMIKKLTGISITTLQRLRSGVNIRVARWIADQILAVNTTQMVKPSGWRHPYLHKGKYVIYED
jgi:transposase-like protein